MADPPDQSGLEILVPPEVLARYQILETLGQGAMGDVYLARSKEIGARVAIKVIRDRSSQQHQERFLRECEAVEKLDHPFLVELYEYGAGPGGPYMVMRYVEGRSLAEKPPLEDPVEVMLGLAEAIDAIHSLNLVHRDIKPANVMINADGEPILIDFGVVLDPDRKTLTHAGAMVGTLCYMAPELLQGQRAGPAADWFAWGVTAYEVIEGALPFTQGEMLELMDGRAPPRPKVRRLLLFPGLSEAVLRALSPDPAGRPGSSEEIRGLMAGAPAEVPGEENVTLMAPGEPSPPAEDDPDITVPEPAASLIPGPAPAPAPEPEPAPAPVRHRKLPGNFPRVLGGEELPEVRSESDRTYQQALDHLEAGRTDEAEMELRRAYLRDGDHRLVARELGILLANQEDFTQALRPLERALELDEGDPEVRFFRGICLQRLGRSEEAEAELRRFLGEAPGSAMRARAWAEKRLDEILRGPPDTGPSPAPGRAPPRVPGVPFDPEATPSRRRPRAGGVGPGALLFLGLFAFAAWTGYQELTATPEEVRLSEPVTMPLMFLTAARNVLLAAGREPLLVEELADLVRDGVNDRAAHVGTSRGRMEEVMGVLSQIGDRDACRALALAAKVKDPGVQVTALDALAGTGTKEGAQELNRFALGLRESPDDPALPEALRGLAVTSSPRGPEALASMVGLLAERRESDERVARFLERVSAAAREADPGRMLAAIDKRIDLRRGARRGRGDEEAISALRSLRLEVEP